MIGINHIRGKVFLLPLLAVMGVTNAQTSWVFPMVFQDATGMSDTLWFIQNNNATIGIDVQFGEGQCEIDTSRFGVFFIIENIPSKVLSIPFSVDFEEYIFATKWEFPITISWNKSLFYETIGGIPPIQDARLLNSYSEDYDLYGNMVFDDPGWFILGIDFTGPQPPFDENNVEAWDEFYRTGYASEFFPMAVTLSRDLHGVGEIKMEGGLQMEVFPNPAKNTFTITGKDLKQAEVFNTLGQHIATAQGEGEQMTVDISALPAGVYFVNVTDKDGRKCVRKVVKE